MIMKRTERNMQWARSYIHNFTLGEEDEREKFLRSDEDLQALSAQLDGLRTRRNALEATLVNFPNDGFQTSTFATSLSISSLQVSR